MSYQVSLQLFPREVFCAYFVMFSVVLSLRQRCFILKPYNNRIGEEEERESRKQFSLNGWVKRRTEQRA